MSVIRPVFRERQVLGAADFAAEQSARIDQLAGHAGAAHLAGVAAGLALLLDGDIVEAAPGVAILPSGRMPCVDMILRLDAPRSEEHTSELQSLIRISYAVFVLKKKKNKQNTAQLQTKINQH